MSIARSQMNRQLYAGGGIMELAPRSKFGLGSKLKKFVRNIIPNEISEIAVKAAPFVAPFNPLLAGAMAGIGSFDQSGSLSNALKSGLLTYGGGQFSRFLGGAGFQQGINPFAGYNPSASFGGLGSLFTSPIGTTSGLKLGQYELFGGTPTQKLISDTGGLPTESIFVQPGQPGTTYLPSDFATEALPLEAGSITSSGQIVSGTAAQNQAILDQLAKQPMTGITSTVTPGVTSTTPGYTDLFKQLLSGDLSQKTEAIKQLGGKALKDIYTTKAKDGSTQIDKLALGATIAGGMSYFEAQKAAKEADLVKEEEEYTKAMYEADRQRYKDYYSQILKPEYFGITAKAKGGRVGYKNAGIVSLTDEDSGVIYRDEKGNPITKEEAMKLFNQQAEEENNSRPLNREDILQFYSDAQTTSKLLDKVLKDKKFKDPNDYRRLERIRDEYVDRKYDLDPTNYPDKKELIDAEKYFDKINVDTRGIDIKLNNILMNQGSKEFGKLYNYGKVEYNSPEGIQVVADKLGIPFEKAKDIKDVFENRLVNMNLKAKMKDRGIDMKADGGIIGLMGGGRIGYKDGKDPYDKLESKIVSINPMQDDLESQLGVGAAALAPGLAKIMSRGVPTFSSAEKTAIIRTLAGRSKGTSAYQELGKSIPEAKAIMDNPAANLKDAVILKEFVKNLFGKKEGGIMDLRDNFAMGSEVPVRQNQAGVSEMDYRNIGGFVPPIGVKEKADDIPAMLSNNEFVFTADAVRAAGGGSINKGAQKMYALMKQLEGQVV